MKFSLRRSICKLRNTTNFRYLILILWLVIQNTRIFEWKLPHFGPWCLKWESFILGSSEMATLKSLTQQIFALSVCSACWISDSSSANTVRQMQQVFFPLYRCWCRLFLYFRTQTWHTRPSSVTVVSSNCNGLHFRGGGICDGTAKLPNEAAAFDVLGWLLAASFTDDGWNINSLSALSRTYIVVNPIWEHVFNGLKYRPLNRFFWIWASFSFGSIFHFFDRRLQTKIGALTNPMDECFCAFSWYTVHRTLTTKTDIRCHKWRRLSYNLKCRNSQMIALNSVCYEQCQYFSFYMEYELLSIEWFSKEKKKFNQIAHLNSKNLSNEIEWAHSSK